MRLNADIALLHFVTAGWHNIPVKNARVELINTGTELLLGSIVKTIAAWLGQRLFKEGLRVARQTIVPDGDAIECAMRECAGRADLVIVSGGLGPTGDDVTVEALCKVCGVELRRDENVAQGLKTYFEKRNMTVAESNFKQALVPVGARILPNDNGTAPGLFMPATATTPVFILLPGPPAELKPMVEHVVLPLLADCRDAHAARLQVYKLVGIGESKVQDVADAPLNSIPGLEVAYCARAGEVDVRLVGDNAALEAGEDCLLSILGDYVLRPFGASLEEAVVERLAQTGKKLATAESCTGGLIAKRVTDVPGASAVFEYGWVTYANEAKTAMLGVPEAMLAAHGAVSEHVVRAMAEGALERSGADVAVAVSGIAGPGGGTPEKPVGTVWLAWAFKTAPTLAEKMFYPRDRDSFRQAVSQRALAGVLKGLE